MQSFSSYNAIIVRWIIYSFTSKIKNKTFPSSAKPHIETKKVRKIYHDIHFFFKFEVKVIKQKCTLCVQEYVKYESNVSLCIVFQNYFEMY